MKSCYDTGLKPAPIPVKLFNIFLPGILLMTLWLVASVAVGQEPTAGKTFRLSGIEINGLQRNSKDQAVAASGLQMGQRVDIAALDAAAQRLLDSGLFAKLSYRLHTNGDDATVTFEVVEAKSAGVPVVFDNFIWFTDEELTNAIRREVPSFDGTAPESSGVINNITKALQQLLQTKKIAGTVEYTPSADAGGGNARNIFSVKGAKIKICSLHFPGARDVPESELVTKSKLLFENDYSREFVKASAEANLLPLYREHGHLRAGFMTPSATIETKSDDNCQGASVTVPVDEGGAYAWSNAEWTGNSAFSDQELDAALRMKPSELANGVKIDDGLLAIRRLYGTRGFLTAKVAGEPSLDDSTRRVTYHILITEGPQYRMGTLTINGLPDVDTEYLKEKWKLKQGTTFDDSYYKNEFGSKVLREYIDKAIVSGKFKIGSPAPSVDYSMKSNPDGLNVDVTIEVKNLTQ